MAANMAAIKTTKPYNFWTALPISLKFGRYINYMILHMFHLLSYTNSRWPPSWLPIWPPLKLQNPITFEPLSRFCSNLLDISIIWSYIWFIIIITIILLGYTNSRWLPSWLPIWPPLKLQNPITFEPLCRFCSNLVDISTIWSYIFRSNFISIISFQFHFHFSFSISFQFHFFISFQFSIFISIISLKFGRYINYMILHMFHLLGYTNSRWPPSWLANMAAIKTTKPYNFWTAKPISLKCN